MRLCECGHPQDAHAVLAWRDGGNPTPCRATIKGDGFTYPCACHMFRGAKND
jgi:hypothetical protein